MSIVRKVRIDALPESAYRHLDRDALVCIDIMLASTTIVTSVAQGRAAFAVRTAEEALEVARRLRDPILAVELDEPHAEGFESRMGPAKLSRRGDVARPLVLVSPLANLLSNARGAAAVYVACLRNQDATVEMLVRHERVALLGGGHSGEQRCEDRIAAARIAQALIARGFEPEDLTTVHEVSSWAESEISLMALGKSADYLRRQGRAEEVDFILGHRNDADVVCAYDDCEVSAAIGETVRPSSRTSKVVDFARGTRLALGEATR